MDLRKFWVESNEKIIFFALAIFGALLDIVTKAVVFSGLGVTVATIDGVPRALGGKTLTLLGDTLAFRCTVNAGAVFGLFQGRWAFLVIFTLISLGIILWIIFMQKKGRRVTVYGLALVCAGAVGNLWDRILYNGVRDFIDFRAGFLEVFGFQGGHWPTFNVADIWICVGIGLIFLGDFVLYREGKEPVVPADEEEKAKGKKKGKKKKKQ
jgi:signal peptidase II